MQHLFDNFSTNMKPFFHIVGDFLIPDDVALSPSRIAMDTKSKCVSVRDPFTMISMLA